MKLVCKTCHIIYKPKYKYGKSYLSKRKYCSNRCSRKDNKTKFKKGHKPRYKAFGENNWMFGKIGEKAPCWKGGRRKNKSGYIIVHVGKRKVMLEHRVIMEKYLGRKLFRDEWIHHKNKNRSDNKISNLMLIKHGEPNAHQIKCPKCNFEWLWR